MSNLDDVLYGCSEERSQFVKGISRLGDRDTVANISAATIKSGEQLPVIKRSDNHSHTRSLLARSWVAALSLSHLMNGGPVGRGRGRAL